jgi:hypothetical protein
MTKSTSAANVIAGWIGCDAGPPLSDPGERRAHLTTAAERGRLRTGEFALGLTFAQRQARAEVYARMH